MTDANQPSNPPSSTPVPGVNISNTQPYQPTTEQIGVFLNNLLTQPDVRQYLDNVRYRVLFTRAIENLDKNETQTQPIVAAFSGLKENPAATSVPAIADGGTNVRSGVLPFGAHVLRIDGR